MAVKPKNLAFAERHVLDTGSAGYRQHAKSDKDASKTPVTFCFDADWPKTKGVGAVPIGRRSVC